MKNSFTREWWKEGVVYQIYPRSFNDSNGDGIGDLQGVIEKIDYLKNLGVDIVWLCPVYKSPNDDNGYDISDYYQIMSEFGELADLEELIQQLHQRDMKLILDLVVNHTSDEHPWFLESRSAKDNSYRDYYIWGSAQEECPPNNWGSWFGGSAWEYERNTAEYYLHIFSRKQPDLNWENPAVRNEIYQMMEWWLEKGVDGFRMDVINLISKEQSFPDGEKKADDKYGDGSPYFVNGPKVHEYLQEMNEKVLANYDIMTVGETPGVTADIAAKYVNYDRNELNMVFHFDLVGLDNGETKWQYRDWKLTELKGIFRKWYQSLKEKGWNSLYMNNHDQPRMVSRFADDKKYRKESAKMLATLLHTLPGTPYIYQGEEIGMTNVAFDSIEDYRDIETLNWYQEQQEAGKSTEEIMEAIYRISRDNARTPMQWNDSSQAGFTSGQPWIKVNPNYKDINVAASLSEQDSIFNYYRSLIALRKEEKNLAIVYGDYQEIVPDDEQIYAYIRELPDELRKTGEGKILVILNFSGEEAVFESAAAINSMIKNSTVYSTTTNNDAGNKVAEEKGRKEIELLLANYPVPNEKLAAVLKLRPYEARVYRLT